MESRRIVFRTSHEPAVKAVERYALNGSAFGWNANGRETILTNDARDVGGLFAQVVGDGFLS